MPDSERGERPSKVRGASLVVALASVPLFKLFVARPGLALAPPAVLAAYRLAARPPLSSRQGFLVWIAVSAWLAYACYERFLTGWTETADTPIRADLLLIAPAISLVLFAAARACWRADRGEE